MNVLALSRCRVVALSRCRVVALSRVACRVSRLADRCQFSLHVAHTRHRFPETRRVVNPQRLAPLARRLT